MAEYFFSRRAAVDLGAIADYTIKRHGIEQSRRYREELGTCLDRLADNLRLGRRAEHLGAGLRRYEYRSHIIFYQQIGTHLQIVRVLHYRREVPRHLW